MTQALDKAVSRLAQYRPFAHDGRDVQAALRELVLGAAAEAGGGFSNLGECQSAIASLFDLEIEIDELRIIVDHLVTDGACKTDHGGFSLSSEQHNKLEKRATESREVEEHAFRDWEASVRAIDPELSDDDFVTLRQDLDAWLQQVISRHGVEAALILYPENPRAHALYRQLDDLGLNFLPTDRSPAVQRVREAAIQLFVQQPTHEQRTYLSNLLNVAYFITVLSLDPSASRLIYEQVNGHRVYLDTNVLYQALGLSDLREVLAARRVLDLTKQLGFELAITPWTLKELKESLRRAEQAVKSRALPPQELAGLMADATSQEGFITAYWRQYKDKGITPKDFFDFYSALETLLESDGIKVVDEGVLAIDRSEEDVTRELPVLESILVHSKAEPVLRHDVKHRLLIDRLRGAGNLTFANARYWFLTQDSALPRYADLRSGDDEAGVPFCASTSAWAQVIRSLVPRTEDLDQALVDLLASPYMRYRGGVSPRVVQEVVARIDQFEGVSPNLASEVLLNGALIHDISRTEDADARAEKIDNALIKSAEHLHEKIETISRSETEQREALRTAQAEKQSSKQDVEAAYARIHELERTLGERSETESSLRERADEAEKRRELALQEADQRASDADAARAALESRVAQTETDLQAFKAAHQARARRTLALRWVGAVFLWLSTLSGAAIALTRNVISGVWPVVGLLLGGLVVICLGIWLVTTRKTAWQVFAVTGIVVGVLAAIQQLVAAAA